MYIAFEKDPNRDSKRAIIVFVLCLVFFALAFKCSGQACSTRVKPFFNSDSTRFVSCEALAFGVNNYNGEDVIQVGILADSLDNNTYSPVIFVWFPKSSNKVHVAEIDFGFKSAGIETLKHTLLNKEIGYAEYRLTKEQAILFRENLYEYVNFRINYNELTYAEDWVIDPMISNFLKMF